MRKPDWLLFAFFLPCFGGLCQVKEDSAFIRENYFKIERMIPMRDGIKLFTAIYSPKDAADKHPILMERTPYSCEPYGDNSFPNSMSPSSLLLRERFIIVIQDVRGRHMSEGIFEEMTPHVAAKKGGKVTDESTDTFDTIEWLLKNVKNNNGRVGIHGISYPGFYATASLIDAHPALKAVSPQAPVTDEFIGDDAYHNGAFFLLDNFGFLNFFDHPRTAPWKEYPRVFNYRTRDAYQFFLDLGSIKNANEKYFKDKSKIWNEYVAHNKYDDYWKARNIRQHLKNTKPAVLVVGGWFDAEDLFGALNTYQSIEKQNPVNRNYLIMGPWTHGAWSSREWTRYVTQDFGSNVNTLYRDREASFFNFFLADKGTFNLPEATVFETGSNQWKSYEAWPPPNRTEQKIYFQPDGGLSFSAPEVSGSFREYVSDPSQPVPYTSKYQGSRDQEYMALDQRFASTRTDVVTYKTAVLEEDITLSGPLAASLFFSTTGTDADFVVKLIDVLPEDTPNPNPNPTRLQLAGLQQLVRGEVFRGKFRKGFEEPVPFMDGQVEEVRFGINDVSHTFRKGHRIMVQVQHSWFPLVDRNPQKFVDIGKAESQDFQKATHRIYHDKEHPSHIVLPVVK